MDEKYIQNLYNQLGGEGRFGKYEKFKNLMNNNSSYRREFHSTIGESTLGKYENFEQLVKKKEYQTPSTGGSDIFSQVRKQGKKVGSAWEGVVSAGDKIQKEYTDIEDALAKISKSGSTMPRSRVVVGQSEPSSPLDTPADVEPFNINILPKPTSETPSAKPLEYEIESKRPKVGLGVTQSGSMAKELTSESVHAKRLSSFNNKLKTLSLTPQDLNEMFSFDKNVLSALSKSLGYNVSADEIKKMDVYKKDSFLFELENMMKNMKIDFFYKGAKDKRPEVAINFNKSLPYVSELTGKLYPHAKSVSDVMAVLNDINNQESILKKTIADAKQQINDANVDKNFVSDYSSFKFTPDKKTPFGSAAAPTGVLTDAERNIKKIRKLKDAVLMDAGVLLGSYIVTEKYKGDMSMSSLKLGREVMKMLDPHSYQQYVNAGGEYFDQFESQKDGGWGYWRRYNTNLDSRNRDMVELGNRIKFLYGNRNAVQKAVETGDALMQYYTKPIEEEVKHKIAVMLKNNSVNPRTASDKQKDLAASMALSGDELSIWNNRNKQSGNTDLPSTGFGYTAMKIVGELFEGTGRALFSWMTSDNLKTSTLSEIKKEWSSWTMGQIPSWVATVESIEKKMKNKEEVTLNELIAYETYKPYVNSRTGWEKIQDYMGIGAAFFGTMGIMSMIPGAFGSQIKALSNFRKFNVLNGIEVSRKLTMTEVLGGTFKTMVSFGVPNKQGLNYVIAAIAYPSAANQAAMMYPYGHQEFMRTAVSALYTFIDTAVERLFPEERSLSVLLKSKVHHALPYLTHKNLQRELNSGLIEKLAKTIYRTIKPAVGAGTQEGSEEVMAEGLKNLFSSLVNPDYEGAIDDWDGVKKLFTQSFWGGFPIGIPGGVMNFKHKKLPLEVIWNSSSTDNGYISTKLTLYELLNDGAIDQEGFNERVGFLDLGRQVFKSNPVLNDDMGGRFSVLSVQKQQNYFARLLNEAALRKQMGNIDNEFGDDKVAASRAKEYFNTAIKESEKIREQIYSGELEVDDDGEELTPEEIKEKEKQSQSLIDDANKKAGYKRSKQIAEQKIREQIYSGELEVDDDGSSIVDVLEKETPILENDKVLKSEGLPDLEIFSSTEVRSALESEIGGDKGVIDDKVRYIPVQEFDYTHNKRSKQIAEQIKESEWIEPLIVSFDKDGNIYTVEGQHRGAALQELGYDKAPVRVIYDKTQFKSPLKGEQETAAKTPSGSTKAEGGDGVSASTFAILDRVNNAEYINEKEISAAEDELYELLDKNPEAANLIEPLILKLQDYEFTTKTETVTVTEKVPTGRTAKTKVKVKPILEQGSGSRVAIIKKDGARAEGVLRIEDGRYVLYDDSGKLVHTVGEKAINDRDLSLPNEQEIDNPISFDENGNVVSVTVKTRDGSFITIKNPEVALDIAIQLRVQEFGEVPDGAFNEVYEEVKSQVEREVPKYSEKLPSKTPKQEAKNVKKETKVETKPKGKSIAQTKKEAFLAKMKAKGGSSGVDIANEDSFRELLGSVSDSRVKTTVVRMAKLALRSLKTIYPNFRLYIHVNEKTYNDAMAELGGTPNSRGNMHPPSNRIDINLSRANLRTVGHEAMHAGLLKAFGDNPELFKRFKVALSKLVDKDLDADLNKFLKRYSEYIQPEEYLAELGGVLRATGMRLKTSVAAKIAKLINDIIEKVTLGRLRPFQLKADVVDIVDFLNTFSESIQKGKPLSIGKDTGGTGVADSRSMVYGGFEKKGFEESEDYKKLKELGYVVENFDIRSLRGKNVVIINPDNMITGVVVDKNGNVIITGNGGIHFVSKFGDVFASSNYDTADSIAKYINKIREDDIKNGGDGVVHIVVIKGTLGKTLTSHTGAKGVMSVLEHLIDEGLIPLKDFRSALISAGKEQKIDFNGNADTKSIHNDIRKKFFGVNDSSFKNRGFFVKDVIDHLAENSVAARSNIEKIREVLNSKEVKRKIDFKWAGIRDAIGALFSDQMTMGVPDSYAYATIAVSDYVHVYPYKEMVYDINITNAAEKDIDVIIGRKLEKARKLEKDGSWDKANEIFDEILKPAIEKVKNLFVDLPNVSVSVAATKGNFFKTTEPSLEMEVHDSGRNFNEIARRLAETAELFKQKNLHISQRQKKRPSDAKLGEEQPDGSIFEPDVKIDFGRQLTENEIFDLNNLIQSKKLPGSTLFSNKNGIILYNLSKFKTHEEFISETKEAIKEIKALHRGGIRPKIERGTRRVWNIGGEEGGGTRTYEQIRALPSKVPEVAPPKHESHPYHIRQNNRQRPVLNILSETHHIKEIANPKKGSTNLGTNNVGVAEATIKKTLPVSRSQVGESAKSRSQMLDELAAAKEVAMDEAVKPELTMEFLDDADFVRSSSPREFRLQQRDIRKRFLTLKELVNCKGK